MSRPPADIDPRTIAADFFKRLGGMAGMVKWGRTHRSLAYQLIAKLMAQPQVVNTVNVANVKIDGEAARAKLYDAFLHQIEARRTAVGDPAVFVNGQRIIEHVSQTPPPVTDDKSPSADVSRPATADPPPATADPPPRPVVQSFVPGQSAGGALDGSDDNRSTTQKFLDWNGHGKLF